MPACRFCDHEVPAGRRNCPACGAELSFNDPSDPAGDLVTELRDLIDGGKNVEAIKRYREATGTGLAKAHAAIESFIATGSLPEAISGKPEPDSSDVEFETEILNLLSAGKTLDAIKLYRERKGVSLKVATDSVNSLAARHGISPRGAGCLGAVLLAIALGTLLVTV